MKIVVKRYGSDYIAHFNNDVERWSSGSSINTAIGNLICTKAGRDMGIELDTEGC
jgi:hypothetical protein